MRLLKQHHLALKGALWFLLWSNAMAELDNRKDQIMSCLVVALANLGMWIREQYFPSSYGGARWKRLGPFFKLGGWVRQDLQTIQVSLRGFNNSELNRDLREVCEKVNIAQVKMADGRQLLLGIEEPSMDIKAVNWKAVSKKSGVYV